MLQGEEPQQGTRSRIPSGGEMKEPFKGRARLGLGAPMQVFGKNAFALRESTLRGEREARQRPGA